MSKKNFTTFDIARICDVQPATVAYWIEKRQLKAYKTPGGHRRVTPVDLFRFLSEHQMPIPQDLRYHQRPRVLIVWNGKNGNVPPKLLKERIGEDYKVELADDPFQAGMLMAGFKPQCVVLFFEAPIEENLELCREIQAADKNGQLVILALAKQLSPPMVKNMQALGVKQCLPADTPISEIHQLIRGCLN